MPVNFKSEYRKDKNCQFETFFNVIHPKISRHFILLHWHTTWQQIQRKNREEKCDTYKYVSNIFPSRSTKYSDKLNLRIFLCTVIKSIKKAGKANLGCSVHGDRFTLSYTFTHNGMLFVIKFKYFMIAMIKIRQF